MSDEIGEIALMFCTGGDNMGQIANRMLIEAIFKAKEKLKEKRKKQAVYRSNHKARKLIERKEMK